jgi:hypothetical protein
VVDAVGYRVRRDRVKKNGIVTIRYRGHLHHIGVGRPYAGWRMILLVAGKDIRILGIDGSPLRQQLGAHVVLHRESDDPTRAEVEYASEEEPFVVGRHVGDVPAGSLSRLTDREVSL